jgi:hypothetical protein
MNEVFKKYFSYITKKEDVELTSFQKQLISYFLKKNNISIIKNRQVGFTISIISYILFLIESNSNKKNIVILVPNNATANSFMNYIANYISTVYNLSDFDFSFSRNKIKIFDYNISIIMDNGLKNNYAFKGVTPDLLIIDEAEFIGEKNFVELEFLFSIILARSGQVICGSSIRELNNVKAFQKRHFKGLQLSNVYTRHVILEKKQKKRIYNFEIPFSIDLREVF